MKKFQLFFAPENSRTDSVCATDVVQAESIDHALQLGHLLAWREFMVLVRVEEIPS